MVAPQTIQGPRIKAIVYSFWSLKPWLRGLLGIHNIATTAIYEPCLYWDTFHLGIKMMACLFFSTNMPSKL